MTNLMLVIPHLDAGGAEKLMLTLCDHLEKTAFRLVLVVLDKRGIFSGYVNSEIEIIDLRCPRVSESFGRLIRLVREKKPDVVFSALSHLNIVMGLIRLVAGRGVKFVAREASLPSLQNRIEKTGFFLDCGIRLLYNGFNAIICQSEEMAQDLAGHYHVRRDKLAIIHNPVDTERIEGRSKEPAAAAFRGAGKRYIAIGRLSPEKGFDRLLGVLSRTAETYAECLIIGEGRERTALEADIRRLGLENRVRLVGALANPMPCLAQADLFLLTSHYEGFPNAVLEALALGVPVFALACPGGIKHIIRHGQNGRLFENEETMAESLSAPLMIEWTKAEIKKDVRERFGAARIAGEYSRLFADVQAAR